MVSDELRSGVPTVPMLQSMLSQCQLSPEPSPSPDLSNPSQERCPQAPLTEIPNAESPLNERLSLALAEEMNTVCGPVLPESVREK